MENADDMVMLGIYYDLSKAYVDKGVLETNGVQSFLTNELTGTILTGLSFAEIRLMVMRKDLEQAKQILSSSVVPQEDNVE